MSHGEFVVFWRPREEEVVEEGVRSFRARPGMWEEGLAGGWGLEAGGTHSTALYSTHLRKAWSAPSFPVGTRDSS